MAGGVRSHGDLAGIDLIVCWPRDCDYPLWRTFLRDNRWRFARVLTVFTDGKGEDISGWLRGHLDATCLDSPPPDRDWRDTAVNHALDHSRSEWVWFTEQDFTITAPAVFWPQMTRTCGWLEADRWHPSSLLCKRTDIDRTSRYFGTPPVDHFWQFGRELERLTTIAHLDGGWSHQQGVSHNHHLIDAGNDAGIFHRDEFRAYLRTCLAADVPLEPGWADRARQEVG